MESMHADVEMRHDDGKFFGREGFALPGLTGLARAGHAGVARIARRHTGLHEVTHPGQPRLSSAVGDQLLFSTLHHNRSMSSVNLEIDPRRSV